MRYYINCDQSYRSTHSFEETVTLIKGFAEDEGNYNTSVDILIIHIDEGVFIRTKEANWCELLDALCNLDEDSLFIYELKNGEWDELTRKYKYPSSSFGDERLVRWKVGFQ